MAHHHEEHRVVAAGVGAALFLQDAQRFAGVEIRGRQVNAHG